MKKLLLLTAIASLLASTGCLVAEGGRGHGRYEHGGAVIVGPPVVEVRVPVVEVRPPMVIVR